MKTVIGMNSKEHIKSIILGLLVLISIVLTYLVWNYTPDLNNVTNSDSSKKNEPKPLSKPMTASMEGTVTPFQIIHSKDDKPQGRSQQVMHLIALRSH